jgi:hypothetical protein
MEYLADVFDFANGAHQHCHADAANSNEVNSYAKGIAPSWVGIIRGQTWARRYLRPFVTIKLRAEAVQ